MIVNGKQYITDAELLAELRNPERPEDDTLAMLRALSCANSHTPEIQDAIDGAIGEIEGYQDKMTDEARENEDWTVNKHISRAIPDAQWDERMALNRAIEKLLSGFGGLA
jgi:hypothetical protein